MRCKSILGLLVCCGIFGCQDADPWRPIGRETAIQPTNTVAQTRTIKPAVPVTVSAFESTPAANLAPEQPTDPLNAFPRGFEFASPTGSRVTQAQIRNFELQLRRARATYTSNHPRIKSLEAQLEAARSMLQPKRNVAALYAQLGQQSDAANAKYESFERDAAALANRIRRDGGNSKEAHESLEKTLRAAFLERQRILRAEIRKSREELDAATEQINRREGLIDTIVRRRMEELLNGDDLNWSDSSEQPNLSNTQLGTNELKAVGTTNDNPFNSDANSTGFPPAPNPLRVGKPTYAKDSRLIGTWRFTPLPQDQAYPTGLGFLQITVDEIRMTGLDGSIDHASYTIDRTTKPTSIDLDWADDDHPDKDLQRGIYELRDGQLWLGLRPDNERPQDFSGSDPNDQIRRLERV